MYEQINNFIVLIADYLLGWILYLPRDLMLASVALMTSAVLTFVRVFSTDQNWLRRAGYDKKHIAFSLKLAKAQRGLKLHMTRDRAERQRINKDYKAETVRLKAAGMLIKTRSAKYEFKPLLYALVPIVLLATWAFARLGYKPVEPGQTVTVKAYYRAGALERQAHLAPIDGIEPVASIYQTDVLEAPPPPEGWWDIAGAKTREGLRWFWNKPCCDAFAWVSDDVLAHLRQSWGGKRLGTFDPAQPERVATWTIKADQPGQYDLLVQCGGKTFAKGLLIDSRHCEATAVQTYDEGPIERIELGLQPQKLFGSIGALDFIYFPPWLVAYLLIAVPFVYILKWVCRIY